MYTFIGFPCGTNGKEPTCQCKRPKKCRFNPWIGKIHWKRAWQSIPVFLPGESHGQRSVVGYSPWGRKESDNDCATNTFTLALTLNIGHD